MSTVQTVKPSEVHLQFGHFNNRERRTLQMLSVGLLRTVSVFVFPVSSFLSAETDDAFCPETVPIDRPDLCLLGAPGGSKETRSGPAKFRPRTFAQGTAAESEQRQHPPKISVDFFQKWL